MYVTKSQPIENKIIFEKLREMLQLRNLRNIIVDNNSNHNWFVIKSHDLTKDSYHESITWKPSNSKIL